MEYDNNWFISKSKIVHGDKYDYSLVKYDENISQKIKDELSDVVYFNI